MRSSHSTAEASGKLCVISHSLLHRLDEEEYGGHQLLLMEGLMPAIGVFLVRNSPEAP